MLYQIRNGTVSVGGQTILSHIDFEIKGQEKIAVVGRNGAGKTTLLRLIAGELNLDRDDKRVENGIVTARKISIGMLAQNSLEYHDRTVEEILLEACPVTDIYAKERFLYELEYDRLFTGFGFQKEEKKRKFSSFSGGEQTKISLIRLLLMKPDILLLDEPTNHLDIETVEWLEQYMHRYEKAVVFVSHDRFFLDQVVDTVYELERGSLKRYSGNYTQYRVQKSKDTALQKKAYDRQQAEIKKLNDLIEQFKHKPTKASFARSRKTILERMELVQKPEEGEAHIFTGELVPLVSGSKWVLEAEHLKIGYEQVLLEISLRIRRGQKIGIIGDNGVGKTTFLKTVAGLLKPLSGRCTLGNNIEMGYFDQQTASITSDKRVAEHFHDLFPGMQEKEMRQTLGAYLFHGRDAAKVVSDLSGGEKARLILAEILTSKPNFLVLDEPTNHMDVQAKETLESAFRAYAGTILFVSHDRYFIKQVADAILVFEGQSVMYYPFGYEHYLEHSRRGDGEDLSALMQAEEQAMIAGLRAVPKAERHRLKEIGTKEEYLDWKLGLAAKPMEVAEDRVQMIWKHLQQRKEEEYMPDVTDLEQELQEAWQEWTRYCVEWYDILLSDEG